MLGALALGAQRLLPLLQTINQTWVQAASMTGAVTDLFVLLDAPVLPDQPANADKPTDGRGKFGLIGAVVGVIAVLAVVLAVVVGLAR